MDVAVPFSFFYSSSLLNGFITINVEGLYLYAALDSDDLLYLKEQMEAEDDAERLLRRTEKRAFAAFKISFLVSVIMISFSMPLDLKLLCMSSKTFLELS